MREIKFRAWDTKLKKMYEPFDLVEALHEKDSAGWKDECVFLQSTGLRDKNGREIFEGDIVYIAGQGNIAIEWPFFSLFEASWENDIGEVNGNIYENPSLLEEKGRKMGNDKE